MALTGDPHDHSHLQRELAELTAETRQSEHADERRASDTHRMMELETSTLLGVLLDLAEQRSEVRLTLIGDRSIVGEVQSLGSDVVQLRLRSAQLTLIQICAVTQVSSVQGFSSGSRTLDHDAPTFSELCVDLAPSRPMVSVWTFGASEPLRRRLIGASGEVLTLLNTDVGALRENSWLPLNYVAEVLVSG